MSVLKYLDTIIDEDPERFLKFISVSCDAIKFEDSCCNSCPLRTEEHTCIFKERTVVPPDSWDFWADDAPKSDKDRSKLYMRHQKIHITDILPAFKKKRAKVIEPTPIELPEIPEFVVEYVEAYANLLLILYDAVESVEEQFKYRFYTDDTLACMNQTLLNKLNNLAEARYMRYHVDYSKVFELFDVQCTRQYIKGTRQPLKESEVLCTIIPKDPEQCYAAYKFLTTTEDIEYYAERYNAEQFIKAYARGTFSGGYYS